MTLESSAARRETLILTASNEVADERLARGERAESLFAFKRRLANALDPGADTTARAARFVRACILGDELEGSELSPRAKTSTILRELGALETSDEAEEPAMGYAAVVRAALRAQPDRFEPPRSLATKVAQANPNTIRALTARTVVVRGMYAFSSDDLALFRSLSEALSRTSSELLVEVPGSSQQRLDFTEHDPFAPLADVVAKALQGPPTFIEPRGKLGSASLASAEGRITCVSVRDEWGAAEAAVSRVKALFQGQRGSKVALSDVCIVVSDLSSSVLPPLLTLLGDAGIPAQDPRGFERESAEVVWAATRLAELTVSSTPRELAELFASPAVDLGLEPKQRRDLVSRLRATPRVEAPNLEAILRSLEPTLGKPRTDSLVLAVHEVAGAATRQDAASHLVALWSAFGLPQAADRGATTTLRRDTPKDSLEQRELHVVAREGAYLRALLDAVAMYRSVLERVDGATSSAGVAKVVHEIVGLLPVRMAPLPASRAAVLRIASFEEGLALGAPFVIVVDAARDEVAANERTAKPWEFSTRVWGLVHEARNVTFLVPTFLGGAETKPWEEIAEATSRSAFSLGAAEPAPTKDVIDRVRLETERERYFLSPKRVAGPLVGKLPEGSILDNYVGDGARPIPVTTLESFAVCPFRGYAEHVLSARDKPNETLTMDARKEGAWLHELCARVFEQTRELWAKRPRPAEAILDTLNAIVEAELATAPEGSLRRVEHRYAQFVARQVLLVALMDEEWDYALSEQPFGSSAPNSWPALPLGKEGASIGGRIDRVDVSRDRKSYRVIDYKRGKQEDRLVGITALQLPLYADVVSENVHLPVVEGTYWRLVGKDSGPKQVSAKTWANARETARERANETLTRARAGYIDPNPHLPTSCQTCAVAGVCRRPPFAIPELEGDA
ncbi:MAG: PD-(D/E)XK nuclease family protein [Polyangiaceae bacterium]